MPIGDRQEVIPVLKSYRTSQPLEGCRGGKVCANPIQPHDPGLSVLSLRYDPRYGTLGPDLLSALSQRLCCLRPRPPKPSTVGGTRRCECGEGGRQAHRRQSRGQTPVFLGKGLSGVQVGSRQTHTLSEKEDNLLTCVLM